MTRRRTIARPVPAAQTIAIALGLTLACGTNPASTTAGVSGESSESTTSDGSASESTTSNESETDTETGTGESGTDTDEPLLDLPMPDELPPGCVVASTDYMFLLDDVGGLYRFDPESLIVEPLGQLACPGAVAAMGLTIDRGGTLWALMLDDQSQRLVFSIDPDTLACTPTSFQDPLAAGFAAYALAFSADAVDLEDESLYLVGLQTVDLNPSPDAPAGLARLDLDTFVVEPLGQLPLPNDPGFELCDLKGSGDARLYAFCSTQPTTVAEVEKTDASFVTSETLELEIGNAGAFGLWEDQLWLFTSTGPDGRSQVSTYALGSGAATLVLDDIGFIVVGAANSTCVPYEPVG